MDAIATTEIVAIEPPCEMGGGLGMDGSVGRKKSGWSENQMTSKKQLPISPLLRKKGVKSDTIVAPVLGAGICLLNQQSKSLVSELKYSIKQACGKMGIGETTLRSIIKTGGIAVLNIGGKYLLLERDVEEYLRRNYGTIREAKVEPNRLAPLPENIANSDLITRKAV